MPNRPRNSIIYDGCSFHVAWRCHNKSWLLRDERKKQLYYNLLLKYRDEYKMVFYAYHFMENHIHLIGEIETIESFSNFFRVVNNLFARRINHRIKRRGQVVMERLKSLPIKDDIHMLTVMTYIDLNGVRAGRDSAPEDSKWSSYKYYAYGYANDLLTSSPSYLALSDDPLQRQVEYRAIVNSIRLSDFKC